MVNGKYIGPEEGVSYNELRRIQKAIIEYDVTECFEELHSIVGHVIMLSINSQKENVFQLN